MWSRFSAPVLFIRDGRVLHGAQEPTFVLLHAAEVAEPLTVASDHCYAETKHTSEPASQNICAYVYIYIRYACSHMHVHESQQDMSAPYMGRDVSLVSLFLVALGACQDGCFPPIGGLVKGSSHLPSTRTRGSNPNPSH